MTLKSLVEKNDTTAGRVFDLLIQSLIVLSLISFSIETLPNLGSKTTMWLKRAETITVIIFSIEYALRVFAAQRKFKFIFSFYGLIDLAAILPFYLTSGIDLRAVRVFRLLRLFRAFKLLRYNRALKRFSNAFSAIREELFIFFDCYNILAFCIVRRHLLL